MPRKADKSPTSRTIARSREQRPESLKDLDGFGEAVLQVLTLCHQPEVLGNESPLAAPYFLGHYIDDQPLPTTPRERGQHLIRLLRAAAGKLGDGQQSFLNTVFFDNRSGTRADALADALHMSLREYRRQVPEHVWALARSLRQSAQTALTAEQPGAGHMVGRDELLRDCLATLGAGRSVALTGGTGIGKTTLGLSIRARWPEPPAAFWLTFRRNLNDHLFNVAFALAAFLHRRGAPHSLAEVIGQIQRNALDAERLFSVIRYDLIHLREQALVLCFDELELLQPELERHQNIIRFLEDLRNHAPLLLMGQHIPLDVDRLLPLGALTAHETARLIEDETGLRLPDAALSRVIQATKGTPALIRLLIALHRSGDEVFATPDALGRFASLDALLERLLRRLSEAERARLDALTVFRTEAPDDAWPKSSPEMLRLDRLGLLRDGAGGGIHVQHQFRELIYQRMPADVRRACHHKAGRIMEMRGAFTEAVHHYVCANQTTTAIALWAMHSQGEIERGQAPTALASLRAIDGAALNAKFANLLRLKIAELLKIHGRAAEASDELALVSHTLADDPLSSAHHQELQADLLMMQGAEDRALRLYQSALDLLIASPERRLIDIHVKRANAARKLNLLPSAQHDARLAQMEANTFAGMVEYRMGNYAASKEHLNMALSIASGVQGELERKGWLYSHAANMFWMTSDFHNARRMIDQSIAIHRQRHDIVSEANDLITLSAIEIQQGAFLQAIEACERGLELARPLKHPYIIGTLAANAGEALCAVERWDDARRMAELSIRQESGSNMPYALTVLGWANRGEGLFAAAIKDYESAVSAARDIQDPYAEANAHRQLGDTYAAMRQPAAARASYANSLALYERMKLTKEMGELEALMAGITEN